MRHWPYTCIGGWTPLLLCALYVSLRIKDVTSRQRLWFLANASFGSTAISSLYIRQASFSSFRRNTSNDLPPHATSIPSRAIFRQHVKTFLFSHSYPEINII